MVQKPTIISKNSVSFTSDKAVKIFINEVGNRPVGRELWANAIDTLGGDYLANLLKPLNFDEKIGPIKPPTFTII